MPPVSIDTVEPETVHTDSVVLPNVTGLPDAPPVADTVNVPLNRIGFGGLAAKFVIVCVAGLIATLIDASVAAA